MKPLDSFRRIGGWRGWSCLGVTPALASLFCWLAFAKATSCAETDGLLFGTALVSLSDPAYRTPQSMPAALKERISRYRARAQAFRSRIKTGATKEGPERALADKRRRMEGEIVALIDAPGIEALAADYAVRAKLYYEWEGMSDGPLGEAAFAEEFLQDHPQTVLKPYLALFLAHRYKCAAETLERDKGPAYEQAIENYRRRLEVSLKNADPLFRLVAESMREARYLYLPPDPAPAMPGASPKGKTQTTTFDAEVKAGERFERGFGARYSLRLEPAELGWFLTIREQGRDEDLSRMTPPFHGVPNPREIEGWHFRNSDNSGPNEPGEKNVNAPGELREFIFSPEVGRTVAGPQATSGPTAEEIERVRAFGRGSLRILDLRLGNLAPGRQARIEWMRFRVQLWWIP